MQEVKVSIGQMVPKRVVVLGGTGFVGRAFCERWSRVYPHSTLVVPTRRRHHGRDIQHLPSVELVECRTMDPIALPRLLVGAHAVVNLVAILHGSAAEFKRVHIDLPSQLATACRVAGVRRVIHISALGASTNGSHLPSEYLRTKSAGEEVLCRSGLDVTILRPSVIFGAQDRFLNVFAALQSIAPLMPLACSGAQFQPVWVEDVVSALIHALTHPQTRGQVLECVGPEVFSLAELVRLAGRYAECERLVLPIPKVLGYLQASMMQLWPGQPLLSHDNIRSMSVPNIATGQGLTLPDWGIEPARISAVAPQYLSKRRLCAQHDLRCHLADRN
jgi:uncharacterized protein YbjT (DUF2867 family)